MIMECAHEGIMETQILANAATSAGAQSSVSGLGSNRAYQAIITGTATVALQGSLDDVNWVTLRTSTASEGFSTKEPWAWVRANVTSYTSGAVTMIVAAD